MGKIRIAHQTHHYKLIPLQKISKAPIFLSSFESRIRSLLFILLLFQFFLFLIAMQNFWIHFVTHRQLFLIFSDVFICLTNFGLSSNNKNSSKNWRRFESETLFLNRMFILFIVMVNELMHHHIVCWKKLCNFGWCVTRNMFYNENSFTHLLFAVGYAQTGNVII